MATGSELQFVTVDGYQIDVVTSEEHGFDSEVTSHPVEAGSDITDNIRAQPVTLMLECIVSNTPIGAIAGSRGDVDANGEYLFRPTADAFEWLQRIREARQPVSIATALKLYDNMVLTSLSVPRAVDTGDALKFTAQFVQVTFVVNARAFVNTASGGKVDRGTKVAVTVPYTQHGWDVIQSSPFWFRP